MLFSPSATRARHTGHREVGEVGEVGEGSGTSSIVSYSIGCFSDAVIDTVIDTVSTGEMTSSESPRLRR